MATVTVDVEVDLTDFEDEELQDELEDRGYIIMDSEGFSRDEKFLKLHALFDAVQLNQELRVKELLREVAWDFAGRIIN